MLLYSNRFYSLIVFSNVSLVSKISPKYETIYLSQTNCWRDALKLNNPSCRRNSFIRFQNVKTNNLLFVLFVCPPTTYLPIRVSLFFNEILAFVYQHQLNEIARSESHYKTMGKLGPLCFYIPLCNKEIPSVIFKLLFMKSWVHNIWWWSSGQWACLLLLAIRVRNPLTPTVFL